MRDSVFQRYFIRFPVIQLMLAGLGAIALPSAASAATVSVTANDYQTCASDLQGVNLAPEAIATACAAALYPQDLSKCVVQINRNTGIAAPAALFNCERVRRPLELATCVSDIKRGVQNAADPEVLDNCRRSLLPTRFANCVVGLNSRVNLVATQAMTTCIAGGDRPYGVVGDRPQDINPTPPVIAPSLPVAPPVVVPTRPAPAELNAPQIPQTSPEVPQSDPQTP
jgi:hypothetical protein